MDNPIAPSETAEGVTQSAVASDASAEFTLSGAEGLSTSPGRWSPRARRRLSLTIAAGVISTLAGLVLLVAPFGSSDVLITLRSVSGATSIVAGGLIAAQARRLRSVSGPHRLYAPRDPRTARATFVWVWLVGGGIGAVISGRLIGVGPAMLVATSIGFAVAGAGAVWISRWIGAKVERAWPPAEPSQAIRTRVHEWAVFVAFAWGMLSILPSLVLEATFGGLLGQATLGESPLDLASESGLPNVVVDPELLAWLLVSFVFIAPPIEEASKAIGLRFVRAEIQSTTGGLVLGMSIGLGFGFLESAFFILDGVGSFAVLVLMWVRLATLVAHCATTGLTGAGYARARLSGDRRAVWRGLGRAAIVHAVWNALAVGALPLLTLLGPGEFIACCLVLIYLPLLIVAALRVLPRVVTAEIHQSIQDDHALAGVSLPREWSPIEEGLWWRIAGGRPKLPLPDAE